jgi:hypothetical protein
MVEAIGVVQETKISIRLIHLLTTDEEKVQIVKLANNLQNFAIRYRYIFALTGCLKQEYKIDNIGYYYTGTFAPNTDDNGTLSKL